MEEKWSIEKLKGSSWNTWKFQMKHYGLWSLVDGSEVLASEASVAAVALFQSQLHKSCSTVVLAIDSSQVYLVTSCEEPKQAWNALKNHFERDTLANKLLLEKQYFRSRCCGLSVVSLFHYTFHAWVVWVSEIKYGLITAARGALTS